MSHDEAEEKFCEELATFLPEYKSWLDERLREKAEREERERLEKERLERERQERERAEKERLEKERAERERQQRERQLRIQQQEQERLRLEQERLAAQLQQQQIQQSPGQPGAVETASRSLNLGDAPVSMAHNPSSDQTPLDAAKSPSRASIDPAEFRNGLRGHADHELNVGRGELVTVRVPKPEGSGCTRLMWQYSTADYDIG
jgi:multidrug efflux pump subunit AcrA (membrane-fusion protein)